MDENVKEVIPSIAKNAVLVESSPLPKETPIVQGFYYFNVKVAG